MQASDLTQFDLSPTSFPYDTGDHLSIFEGYPNALSNGFLFDMNVSRKDKKLLQQATKTYPKAHLLSSIHYLEENYTEELVEPSEAHMENRILLYQFTHPVTHATFGIQLRHWNYMRYRYPGCVFLYGRCEHTDILVKDLDTVVGIVAPFNLAGF